MTVQKLIKVLIVGPSDAYPLAEDALSSLKCVDVAQVERGDYHFLIEGWMPQIWFDDLAFILDTGSKGQVALVWEDDVSPAVVAAPVVLKNPRFVRPFEYIVQLFSLPGRQGYDPTLLTFLALPLFFGFVVGDIGYGIAFIAVALVVRVKFRGPIAELASSFLIFGGAWSIVFGAVLFADFFGFHVDVGPLRYHLFDKLRDISQLLLVSLAIGAVHLNLGVALGFSYERRRAGLKVAFLKKISWFILEVGLLLLVLSAIGVLAKLDWIPGVALATLAVVFLSFGGGLTEVIEIPSFVGNLMSYLRLGALGVAKGVFAVTINAIALTAFASMNPVGVVLAGVVLVVGHAFVRALAVLTVSIQSLRLHYVEFYTKFYPAEEIGVTRPFRPTVEFPEPRQGAA